MKLGQNQDQQKEKKSVDRCKLILENNTNVM